MLSNACDAVSCGEEAYERRVDVAGLQQSPIDALEERVFLDLFDTLGSTAWEAERCYKGVTRVLQGCYKGVTRILQW
jgi:hypothetical protein